MKNCANVGGVAESGSHKEVRAGGVVGFNGGRVENCYNVGSVTFGGGNNSSAGGVVGRNNGNEFDPAKVLHCYALCGIAGGVSIGEEGNIAENADVRTLTESEFKNKANFVGWDFNNVWYMGATAPLLQGRHEKVQLWEDGPYWATTNIGAEKPEEYGYYFWWAIPLATSGKTSNGWRATAR